MYKIKYLTTGHEFLLPDDEAKNLKDKFPDEYKILEKNGKKFKEKKQAKKQIIDKDNIMDLVLDDKN